MLFAMHMSECLANCNYVLLWNSLFLNLDFFSLPTLPKDFKIFLSVLAVNYEFFTLKEVGKDWNG